MSKTIGAFILRYRFLLLIAMFLVTLFMGFRASKVKLSYEFAKILPVDDSSYISYTSFKKLFGEDGNIIIIGLQSPNLFDQKQFERWFQLTEEIKAIDGISNVISIPNLVIPERNSSGELQLKRIFQEPPHSQEVLDSLKNKVLAQPLYRNLLYNEKKGAAILGVVMDKNQLNSENRKTIIHKIKARTQALLDSTQVKIHFSGLPYIRTEFTKKVSNETLLFMALAVLITGFCLWIFFRSGLIVLVSLGLVLIGVIWSVGFLQILDYKITILTGLLPPLIIIIGVPNCIFFINSFHKELMKNKKKEEAILGMIENMGLSLFLANVTTAIGFGVLYFTYSPFLLEFGALSALCIMSTYFITLVSLTILLSLLPLPGHKQLRHLSGKRTNKFIETIHFLVFRRRKTIYLSIGIACLLSIIGLSKIRVLGHVVDDIPQKDPIARDIRFFENNFRGVLPFEIMIDTKSGNGISRNNGSVLFKIKNLQKQLEAYPFLSHPLSITEGLKFAYQGYRGGKPKYYVLPAGTELEKLTGESTLFKEKKGIAKSFLDSSSRYTRVSYFMADIGSQKMKSFVEEINPIIDSIFPANKYQVTLTGHSLIFLKGHDYLLKNLIESLAIEIILITLVGLLLFRSVRIIILSKLPCLIPLLITAGIMGFMGIPFKPSTILIFSIAFGISSDGTIYFLTRYRQEIQRKKSKQEAISTAIKETGPSMTYTAVILFAGFSVFAASGFGGTVALGILISITLLVSLGTNLILLPAILLTLAKRNPNLKPSEKLT